VRVAVLGSGYVGLVTGACLAETGNDVICADIDARKIARLKANDIPIYEPGLEELVRRNQSEGRLEFSTEVGRAVESAGVVLVAVGTPPGEDGSADLQHVLAVARTIGKHLNGYKVIATKSTVPVGTAAKVQEAIRAETSVDFSVCSNPEFLKEGAAVDDFMKPDRIIIGVDSDRAREVMTELYGPFVRTGNPVLIMDIASAEVTKYAANAMLATRISFMNQMAMFCERVGADVNSVRKGIGSDRRIGPAFLFPGPGFGGSCFPKDVRALIHTAGEVKMPLDLLEAVQQVNDRQKQVMLAKLRAAFQGRLEGRTVAVWGLSFKAETDDMRESPSIALIEGLLAAGARVRAHDPKAMASAREVFADRIHYAPDPYSAAEGADALAIVTEWLVYRNPNFERLKGLLAQPVIVDGRNLYDRDRLRGLGFTYFGIGR